MEYSIKSMLREKIIAVNIYVERERERSQNNNLIFHLNTLDKEQTKPKTRRKNIIV